MLDLLPSAEYRFEKPSEASRWHYLIAKDERGNEIATSPWFDPVHAHGLPLNQVYIEPMRKFIVNQQQLPISYIQMGPTNLCNLACEGCFSGSMRSNHTISWEIIENTINELSNKAQLEHTGTAMIAWHGPGDPCVSKTTRRTVAKGIELSSSLGIANRIVTNGTFYDPDFIDEIVRNPLLRMIWVSLKTGDSKSYYEHTRKDYRERALKTMEAIVAARAKYGREDDLLLKASTEISMIDPTGFITAAKQTQEIGFDLFKPALHYPGFGDAFKYHEDKIIEGREYLKTLLNKQFLPLYWEIPEKFDKNFKSDKFPNKLCFQAMTRMYFDGKGNASPCIHWLDNSEVGYSLGNLNDVGFAGIWEGEDRQGLLEEAYTMNYCSRCQDPRPNLFHQWIYNILLENSSATFHKKFDII